MRIGPELLLQVFECVNLIGSKISKNSSNYEIIDRIRSKC